MAKIKDYYNEVRDILIEYPKTRDDDMQLYAIFVAKKAGVSKNDTFYYVLMHHNEYNLPSYESVTRARRKVQECEFTLRGTKRTKRKDLQEEYREYYGGIK